MCKVAHTDDKQHRSSLIWILDIGKSHVIHQGKISGGFQSVDQYNAYVHDKNIFIIQIKVSMKVWFVSPLPERKKC